MQLTQGIAHVLPATSSGDIAWMLTSTLLVLMMAVPGVGLFYGGLVRAKNVLSVLIQVLAVFSLTLLLWAFYGYSLVFSGGGALIGDLHMAFLHGLTPGSVTTTGLPSLPYFAFQATFAGIACALIVGALAERMKFGAVLVFTAVWFTLAYLPIAHMVWAPHGWLLELGALDFAGGTVVHINAGVAGLVGAALLGPRTGIGRTSMRPHNLPLASLGAALLWVGWFGFNAGSSLHADARAALAFVDTLLAGAAGVTAWLCAEACIKGQPSVLGGATGMVAALVGITPACGTVGPMGAILVGIVSSLLCMWGVTGLKRRLRVDDALDSFGVHAIGGIAGALLTGIFSTPALGGLGPTDMALLRQLGVQALAVGMTVAWSAVAALAAGLLVRRTLGMRVTPDHEHAGLDTSSHGESAYET
ncbi:MAG TPA: ammonium transporter [Rhodanobacteraceae bacterium]|nr:ammonium transporter [Rhodanobacteraceae bacterium]